ncbi:unnamed protein product [Allacma fusca]|uniref:Uncharacterized protein n=1 Tax=Allacma fusca TaxID=39272 RepID=A0A8J2L2R2_9HEXA|nr:unnamed protein product [Allacma fusca]
MYLNTIESTTLDNPRLSLVECSSHGIQAEVLSFAIPKVSAFEAPFNVPFVSSAVVNDNALAPSNPPVSPLMLNFSDLNVKIPVKFRQIDM